jgi:ABC-type nickel/cobalt efflux system permease component RcnA
MRRLRQFHLYLGTLFAPAIIFFAFSGALQTLGLHENRNHGPVEPQAWIVVLASVHKDQRLPRQRAAADNDHDHHDDAGNQDQHAAPEPDHHHRHHASADDSDDRSPPLKLFVLALSFGLIASAFLGVVIALRNRATRAVTLVMLAVGTALPVALLFV